MNAAFQFSTTTDSQKRTQETEDVRLRRFGDILRQLRLSIPLDRTSLGDFIRLPNRVGRVVSQEEIAEATGVSRFWYGMLESGRQARPSIELMGRLCDVFALDEPRRLALMELGIPTLFSLIRRHTSSF